MSDGHGDSIRIPPERIVPIANETASSAKTIGAVFCFILGLVVFAGVQMVTNPGSFTDGTESTGGTIFGLGFWMIVLGGIAAKFIGNARRAAAAAKAATSTNVEYSFNLTGRMVVVADANSVPLPSRTFKISRKSRAMLLAVPRATVVD